MCLAIVCYLTKEMMFSISEKRGIRAEWGLELLRYWSSQANPAQSKVDALPEKERACLA